MIKTHIPRLKKLYKETIIPAMMKDFGIKNPLAVPRIEKISINVGTGSIRAKDPKLVEQVIENIALITGQRPIIKRAKKSIAGFKLREGMDVGATVTLRGSRMYEFLDRLINITLPRIRDFRGLSSDSFDQQGNYALGIREHTVFPEAVLETTENTFGLQVNIKLNKSNRDIGYALLKYFGFPFRE